MSDKPILEDGDSEINESFAPCDCCDSLMWWDELTTSDDGESWACPACVTALSGESV